jgi:alkylation response protein AidB-like acyl-CoA dehydrogenase
MRESEAFQRDLGVLEARFRAARAYLHATLAEVWDDVAGGSRLTMEHRIACRLATTHAINEGVDVVARAYRLAGQTAIFEANPFEQRLRDAHAASQQVQGRATHYVTVGRHFLGLPPDTTMFI